MLDGKKFGRWSVVGPETTTLAGGRKRTEALCRCTCGTERMVSAESLARGLSKSCGCLRRELQSSKARSPELRRLYRVWRSMLQRCSDEGFAQYKDYGGRGLKVSPRWEVFENFVADMGLPPEGTSLERVDNNLGYGPGNCRWASRYEQARNKRNNRRFTHEGKSLLLRDWADLFGLKLSTLSTRVYQLGWSIERALSEPVAYRVGRRAAINQIFSKEEA